MAMARNTGMGMDMGTTKKPDSDFLPLDEGEGSLFFLHRKI